MNEDRVFRKCAWRLIPFMVLLYVISFIDRSNVGYAALTMNKDLGFSPAVFGFGAGVFFVGYSLCQAPANLILERIGAKRWIFCILAVWGLLSASNAFVRNPASFYALRFLLGTAEAGFFPGMLLYLTYWFPRAYLARCTANFMAAIPLSFAIGGPLSSAILEIDGTMGLRGWQWLFLIEGLPAVLFAFAVLKFLPDRPSDASWLTADEKKIVAAQIADGNLPSQSTLWQALSDPRLLGLGIASFGFQSCAYGLTLWLPQIVHAMGFSVRATGVVVTLPYAAGIAAMIICGRSSSIRRERIWHTSLPWLGAASSLAIASVMQSDTAMLAAITVALIGNFAAYGPFFSLPSSFLRGTAAAGGIGLFNTMGSLGGFFGPTLIGILKQASGDYASGMAALGVGYLLTVVVVLAVGHALASRTPILAATPVS